ncbi:helix-turn-helix domain-containing protein [Streptomyces sp. NPDC002399]
MELHEDLPLRLDGDRPTVVQGDQVQAEVEAAEHSGRGVERVRVHDRALGVDVDTGMTPRQLRRVRSAGGRPASVEEPGGGEGERPRAGRTEGIEPTLRWLEARLHLPLTPADIAAHAGISVSSLNRRFHARTGAGPPQYLLRRRPERARELLETTDEKVDRVAALSGFASPASLRHHFSRLTGTTPRTYRTRTGAARPVNPRARISGRGD